MIPSPLADEVALSALDMRLEVYRTLVSASSDDLASDEYWSRITRRLNDAETVHLLAVDMCIAEIAEGDCEED